MEEEHTILVRLGPHSCAGLAQLDSAMAARYSQVCIGRGGCSLTDRVDDYSVQKLILGTHTSQGDQNHLMIAEVRMPLDETALDPRKYDDSKGGR